MILKSCYTYNIKNELIIVQYIIGDDNSLTVWGKAITDKNVLDCYTYLCNLILSKKFQTLKNNNLLKIKGNGDIVNAIDGTYDLRKLLKKCCYNNGTDMSLLNSIEEYGNTIKELFDAVTEIIDEKAVDKNFCCSFEQLTCRNVKSLTNKIISELNLTLSKQDRKILLTGKTLAESNDDFNKYYVEKIKNIYGDKLDYNEDGKICPISTTGTHNNITSYYNNAAIKLTDRINFYNNLNNICFAINKDVIKDLAGNKASNLTKFEFDFNIIIEYAAGFLPLVISVQRNRHRFIVTNAEDLLDNAKENYTSVLIGFIDKKNENILELVEYIQVDNGVTLALDNCKTENVINGFQNSDIDECSSKSTSLIIRYEYEDITFFKPVGCRRDYRSIKYFNKESIFNLVNEVYSLYINRNKSAKYKSKMANRLTENVKGEVINKDTNTREFISINHLREYRRSGKISEIHNRQHSYHKQPRTHYRREHIRHIYDSTTGKCIKEIKISGSWINKNLDENCNYKINKESDNNA